MLRFFFIRPDGYRADQLLPKGKDVDATAAALDASQTALQGLTEWTHEPLETCLRELSHRIGWASRDLFMALRVAVTGRTVTPPLIESMVVLGKPEVITRLQNAEEALKSLN
jgi:glutamyl-tRNA synthetase